MSEIEKREVDPKRGNRVFGSPTATAAVVGGTAAAIVGRKNAGALGGKIGAKVAGRGDWSAARAAQMKNKTGAKIRTKYAGKVKALGNEIKRSEDTREVTGRAAVGAGAGSVAGGLVYGRKKLTPVEKAATPVVKSADPLFNHKAAQEAVELVMKMDLDQARAFTSMVVADVLEDEIEANQRALQAHVTEVVLKSINDTKNAMMRSVAKADSADSVAMAQALVEFEKAVKNPYTSGAYRFEESDFRRDPRTGRFMTKVVRNPHAGPMKGKQAEMLGIPEKRGLNSEQRAQYHQEYTQLANFLNAVNQSFDEPGHANVMLHLRNKATGQQYTVDNGTGTRPNAGAWDPKSEELEGVEALPSDLTIGGAAFSVTNSLGASSHTGAKVGHGMNQVNANMGQFATNWSNSGTTNPTASNERLYGRVEAGSKFLGSVAPYGSKLQIAAKFGEFVGSRGPEAEKVFGPYTRKLAYRYRGTERTPDESLMSLYSRDVQGENTRQMVSPDDIRDRKRFEERAQRKARLDKAETTKTPIEAVKLTQAEAHAAINEGRAKWNAQRLGSGSGPKSWDAGRERLTAYLRTRIPNANLYELHLDAGNTPPSEGFIIDSKGQVRAQAVGYGDDHYLPFNLKNLGALKGGEYIRTRSVGGPTTEDIYTGLRAGARRITVVSRSGTFVVEFEDDFRGGRRHNDKAKRMVNRYERLLDSIHSETLDRQNVHPEIRKVIEDGVKERFPGASPRERRDEINRRIEEFKRDPEMTAQDEEDFEREFAKQSAGMTDAEAQRVRNKMMNAWAAEKEYKFRLNGPGYEAALNALQEQFPYYLKKPKYINPNVEAERISTEKDKGYVEPGRNRPTYASDGWHGTKGVNDGGSRWSASQSDFQDNSAKYGRNQARLRTYHATPGAPTEAKTEAATPQEAKGEAPAKSFLASVNQADAKRALAQNAAEAGADFVLGLRAAGTEEGMRALENNPRFNFFGMRDKDDLVRHFVANPTDLRRAAEVAAARRPDGKTNKEIVNPEVARRFDEQLGRLDRKPFDRTAAFVKGNQPWLFDGEAYEPGADPAKVEAEAIQLANKHKAYTNPNTRLDRLDEHELGKELDAYSRLDELAKLIPEGHQVTLAEKKEMLDRSGLDGSVLGAYDLPVSHEKLLDQAEAVQRIRALNLARNPKSSRELPVQTLPEPDPKAPEAVSVKDRAKYNIDMLETAANKLDANDSDDYKSSASLLRAAASRLKELHKRPFLSAEDLSSTLGAAQDDLRLAYGVLNSKITPEEVSDYLDRNH